MKADNDRMAAARAFGRLPLYPFLVAVSPVIALAAVNVEQMTPSEAARPLAVLLLGEAALMALLFLATRNWHKAALLALCWTLLFIAYGQVYETLERATLLGEPLGRHRYLMPIWAAAAAGSVWLVRRVREPERWAGVLNAAAGILIVIPLVQLGIYRVQVVQATGADAEAGAHAQAELHRPEHPPDIYYIILDGYARDDVLMSMFGFDNSAFLEELEARGFSIARKSKSNYAQTDLSIASSLNYDYLQNLDESLGEESTVRAPLHDFIGESRVEADLESIGYTTVAFDTGYKATELRRADVFLNPRRQGLLKWIEQGDLSPFESILVYTTGLRVLADSSKILPQFLVPGMNDPYERHRERVLYVLSSLAELPKQPGPKFVFVHLVSPHQPFVFGPNGEPINPSGAFTLVADDNPPDPHLGSAGYIDQVRFLNSRLIPLLDEIVSESETPPVIIIQADHGPPVGSVSAEDRMRILNAYYLPGVGGTPVYDSISPVNTFRVVFREYFEAELPLAEDIAYFSSYKRPYDYYIVPGEGSE